MSAFLMSSLNFPVYFIMGSLFLSPVTFDHLYSLSNSKYAFPGESISSQFDKNLVLNPIQSVHNLVLLSHCLGPLSRFLSTIVLHH